MHYLRDGVFILAWFSLLAAVWFAWALAAPPLRARPWLGTGLAISIAGAVVGGACTWRFWATSSMLDGRLDVFVWVIVATAIVAGITCVVLWRAGRARWNPLAVALVIALHFIPLALLLGDWGLVVLAAGQMILVILAARVATRRGLAPSCTIGAVMGVTLLGSAIVAGALWLPRALAAA